MPLRASSHPGAPIPPVVLPLHDTVVGRDYLPEASPGNEPRPLARQRWHTTATPLSKTDNAEQLLPINWYVFISRKEYTYLSCRIRITDVGGGTSWNTQL